MDSTGLRRYSDPYEPITRALPKVGNAKVMGSDDLRKFFEILLTLQLFLRRLRIFAKKTLDKNDSQGQGSRSHDVKDAHVIGGSEKREKFSSLHSIFLPSFTGSLLACHLSRLIARGIVHCTASTLYIVL